MEFSERFRKALDNASLSAAEFSRRSGLSKGSVSNWINGKTKPNEQKLKIIQETLYIDFDETAEKKKSNKLDPAVAAKYMEKSVGFIYRGLQLGIFPWGYAVPNETGGWGYFINRKKFFEIEGFEEL